MPLHGRSAQRYHFEVSGLERSCFKSRRFDKDIDTSSDQILQIVETLKSVQRAQRQSTFTQINNVIYHVTAKICEHRASSMSWRCVCGERYLDGAHPSDEAGFRTWKHNLAADGCDTREHLVQLAAMVSA